MEWGEGDQESHEFLTMRRSFEDILLSKLKITVAIISITGAPFEKVGFHK
jgi:hypothetical protein